MDVINRGFGGYNTEWLLPVLEHEIIPSVSNVILWVVLIGANDAMLPPGENHVPSTCRGTPLKSDQVPLDKFTNNLLQILSLIEAYHTAVGTKPRLLLFTPPPVREEMVAKHIPLQQGLRSREHTFAYSRAVMELPVPPWVAKLDLHEAIELAPAQVYLEQPKHFGELDPTASRFEDGGMIMSIDDYLSDGLHLKNPSYKIMYNLTMETIGRRWPEIIPEAMPMPVTWWGNLVQGQNQRIEL